MDESSNVVESLMLKGDALDIQELVEVLRESDTQPELTGTSYQSIFQFNARHFLDFAEQDFSDELPRGYINAISNANRAYRCRVDELLWANCVPFMYSGDLKKKYSSKIQEKIRILGKLGINVRSVLGTLVSANRNSLEHSYTMLAENYQILEGEEQIVEEKYLKQVQENIRHAVDIAAIFIEATEKYVERVLESALVTIHTKEWPISKHSESSFLERESQPYSGLIYDIMFNRDEESKCIELKRHIHFQGAEHSNVKAVYSIKDLNVDAVVELISLLLGKGTWVGW